MKLSQKLTDIQSDLKAPKDQTNKFGGYKYRNIEAIQESVKPLLKEHGLVLTFSDSIEVYGDRVYVKATAMLTDGIEQVTASAFAREPLNRKGMDESQITGAASTYARKYAAGGLFLLDDTKDADSMDSSEEARKSTSKGVSAPKSKQEYTDKDFQKNLPAWTTLIESGSHSPDTIIGMVSSKGYFMNPQHVKTLKAIKVS